VLQKLLVKHLQLYPPSLAAQHLLSARCYSIRHGAAVAAAASHALRARCSHSHAAVPGMSPVAAVAAVAPGVERPLMHHGMHAREERR
jgi:hypothetical protein